jgi:hypothetical protein
MGLDEFRERFRMLPVPAAMLVENCLGIVVWREIEGVEQIAMDRCQVRLEFQGAPVTAHGVLQASLMLQDEAEVIVRLGGVRIQFESLLKEDGGLVQIPLLRQFDTQAIEFVRRVQHGHGSIFKKAEDRRQKAEDRRQKAEGRR